MSYPPPPAPVPPASSNTSNTSTGQAAPPSPPARPSRRGCGSQILSFFGWVLTLALSVALALAAIAAIAFFVFGLTPATPNELRQAGADVAALQTQVATLEAETVRLRSSEAESSESLDDAVARVNELEAQVATYEQEVAELAGQAGTAAALSAALEENIDLAATIQAEGREGQVLVAVVATVQADNSARLDDIQARTERLSRFLQRLSDLAGDASFDAPAAEATAEPESDTATPTAASLRTTATPTAVRTTVTPTDTPEPSSTAAPTGTPRP